MASDLPRLFHEELFLTNFHGFLGLPAFLKAGESVVVLGESGLEVGQVLVILGW